LGIFSFGNASSSVGLALETNTFRLVQLKQAAGAPILTHYSSIDVPVGAVVEDEVVDVDVAAQTLARLWKGANVSSQKIVVGIANQKVVIRLVSLPYMEKNELKKAIHYQAQDFIPIPIEEAIIDFDIVGEFTNEDNEHMIEVLLVAAQKDMIENLMNALNGAGLKPRVIDVSSLALVRVLIDKPSVVPDNEGEALALVNIGSGVTNIVVEESGKPRFTRVAPLAGNNFTQRVAETLNVSFKEANELKAKVGLPSLAGEAQQIEGVDAEKVKQIQDGLAKELNKFIGEIRRSIDYYLTQRPGVKSIQDIIVSGNGAKMKNLLPHLERGLQVNVQVGHPLEKVKLGPKLSQESVSSEELGMSICLGLALRGLEE
jgi:type IV pilus assembly protein PilM